MAIKGGQILHVVGGPAATFVVDRIQTGGVTGININEERIEELGNYQAIGTVRDIPDLTFELESYDVTTELESLLTGGDNTETAGAAFDLSTFIPINVISPFKTSGLYTVAGSIIIPFLYLESMSYNFSLTDPATMTATLRGDSVFFSKGGAYEQVEDGDGITDTFAFTNGPAYVSSIAGSDYYGLSVSVYDGSKWVRQRLGTDYTNTSASVVFTTPPPAGTGNIKIVYTSGTAQEFLQGVHNTTDPAAVRGRDIYVSLAPPLPSTTFTNWIGVQSASVDWRVTLERDEEFGNPQVVAQDFDVPEVTGSVTMKPSTVSDLFSKVQEIANLSTAGTDVANATQDPPEMQLRIKITDPADGTTTKTLTVPKAKFSMPALQGNVGSKLEGDFTFTSSDGDLDIHKGDPA